MRGNLHLPPLPQGVWGQEWAEADSAELHGYLLSLCSCVVFKVIQIWDWEQQARLREQESSQETFVQGEGALDTERQKGGKRSVANEPTEREEEREEREERGRKYKGMSWKPA